MRGGYIKKEPYREKIMCKWDYMEKEIYKKDYVEKELQHDRTMKKRTIWRRNHVEKRLYGEGTTFQYIKEIKELYR